MNRFGPSTLVEAGDQKFVFDAGRGALQRLTQLGVHWQDVQGVFLTHLHSDHVVGFPDLWLTGWLIAPERNVPLPIWGPSGTNTMMVHLEQAYQADISVRKKNDGVAPDGVKLLPHDIGEGVVYDRGGVKVTAFEVDHSPVESALGYRIDYAGPAYSRRARRTQGRWRSGRISWPSTWGRSSTSGDLHARRESASWWSIRPPSCVMARLPVRQRVRLQPSCRHGQFGGHVS